MKIIKYNLNILPQILKFIKKSKMTPRTKNSWIKNDMTNINMKQLMFEQRMQEIDADIVPFGFVDDGSQYINELEKNDKNNDWAIEYDPNL